HQLLARLIHDLQRSTGVELSATTLYDAQRFYVSLPHKLVPWLTKNKVSWRAIRALIRNNVDPARRAEILARVSRGNVSARAIPQLLAPTIAPATTISRLSRTAEQLAQSAGWA